MKKQEEEEGVEIVKKQEEGVVFWKKITTQQSYRVNMGDIPLPFVREAYWCESFMELHSRARHSFSQT